jgi:hypothetical protein
VIEQGLKGSDDSGLSALTPAPSRRFAVAKLMERGNGGFERKNEIFAGESKKLSYP